MFKAGGFCRIVAVSFVYRIRISDFGFGFKDLDLFFIGWILAIDNTKKRCRWTLKNSTAYHSEVVAGIHVL